MVVVRQSCSCFVGSADPLNGGIGEIASAGLARVALDLLEALVASDRHDFMGRASGFRQSAGRRFTKAVGRAVRQAGAFRRFAHPVSEPLLCEGLAVMGRQQRQMLDLVRRQRGLKSWVKWDSCPLRTIRSTCLAGRPQSVSTSLRPPTTIPSRSDRPPGLWIYCTPGRTVMAGVRR